jgi:MoaA/NifB/PqqE/SkfB family radical SAM enzyme
MMSSRNSGCGQHLSGPPVLAFGQSASVNGSHQLQRISLELSRRCNLGCVYCYASSGGSEWPSGLSPEEARMICNEAVALGAKRVVIVGGGEPLMHSCLDRLRSDNLVDYLAERGVLVTLFSNLMLLDDGYVDWLRDRPVSIIGKLNSLRPKIQDYLAGRKGAALRMRRSIDLLLSAGYAASSPSRLALETVICKHNYKELPEMWRWMRERNIVPFVEIATVQGRARIHRDWLCWNDEEAADTYRALFEELLRIDETEFGYTWIPHPPHAARSCDLYHTNCYVNAWGGVQPCAGVDQEYGYLRVGKHMNSGQALATILESVAFRRFRQIEKHIGAPCRYCDLLGQCYGCRGNCWNTCGSIYAGDATCWRCTSSILQRGPPSEGSRAACAKR